jgi:predicted DNA-binding protein (MmcQ/YjbR family)
MNTEAFSAVCRSLPAATETVQWRGKHVFKVGDRMFAIADPAPGGGYAFKVDDDRFLELSDLPGFRPAPYLARARWVQVDPAHCVLPDADIEALVRDAYEIIFGRLAKRRQLALRPG